jgi:hypothetical protein
MTDRSPVARASFTSLMISSVASGKPLSDVELSSAATAARSRICAAPSTPEPPLPCSASSRLISPRPTRSAPVKTLPTVWSGKKPTQLSRWFFQNPGVHAATGIVVVVVVEVVVLVVDVDVVVDVLVVVDDDVVGAVVDEDDSGELLEDESEDDVGDIVDVVVSSPSAALDDHDVPAATALSTPTATTIANRERVPRSEPTMPSIPPGCRQTTTSVNCYTRARRSASDQASPIVADVRGEAERLDLGDRAAADCWRPGWRPPRPIEWRIRRKAC